MKIVNKSSFMFEREDIQDDTLLKLYPLDLNPLIQDPANSIQILLKIDILT